MGSPALHPSQQTGSRLTSSTYPNPLIINSTHQHKQTFIILHGRGSDADEFGPDLFATPISASQTFGGAFRHAKFIFPTASNRRAMTHNRSVFPQWFDNGSLQTPTEREELQIEGLRETSAFIHGLLRREIDAVGAQNVVLGGLSQGCAATLISLLTWDGEALGAAFGMCGWLPFRKQMEELARGSSPSESAEDGDIFARAEEHREMDAPTQAAAFLREELDMSEKMPSMSFQHIPLFLGHGTEDEKVPIGLNREAVSCLRAMGMGFSSREYEGLHHWYSTPMLRDLVDFIRRATKWEVNEVTSCSEIDGGE